MIPPEQAPARTLGDAGGSAARARRQASDTAAALLARLTRALARLAWVG